MSISYHYQVGTAVKTVTIQPQGDELLVMVGDTAYRVTARTDPTGRLDLTVDGRHFAAHTAPAADGQFVWLAGKSWQIQHPAAHQPPPTARAQDATGTLTTAMPGLVTAILVQVGDAVERGAPLVILEAMKMEMRITAPYAGRVSKVACSVGQVVTPGALLVEISRGEYSSPEKP
jgi:3-methylcrotonyl-CoA carboxylase alpha subunit